MFQHLSLCSVIALGGLAASWSTLSKGVLNVDAQFLSTSEGMEEKLTQTTAYILPYKKSLKVTKHVKRLMRESCQGFREELRSTPVPPVNLHSGPFSDSKKRPVALRD